MTNVVDRRVVFLMALPALALNVLAGGTLANEPFLATASPVALQSQSGGSGWGAAWEVQNGNTTVPGYNIATAQPLTYAGIGQSGGYGAGGSNWQAAGRTLDTNSLGPFAAWLNNGLVGAPGTTVYLSLMMRQDAATGDEISVTLHPGASPAWQVTSAGAAVGCFGGSTRYWGLKLNGLVYPSKVPVVTGQTALLVLRIVFGATNTISLFVNPSLTALPATPDAAATTTSSVAFRSLAYYGGSGSGLSSFDEIRFAGDYASLGLQSATALPAPGNLSATAGDALVSLSWTPVTGAASYRVYQSAGGAAPVLQASATSPAVTISGLTNGVTYTYTVTTVAAKSESAKSSPVSATPRRTAPAPHPSLGSNLSQVADFSRSWPFVDAFKMARTWIPQMLGAAWGAGPALQLDSNGWVKSLSVGQYAETIILDNQLDDAKASYPTGDYTLLYDGSGTIAFDLQSASIVSQTPGRMVVNVPPGHNGVFLMITATNAANPIRNIRFIMPGFESTYATQPFHPLFLASLKNNYKAMRFMEWALVNGSGASAWSSRPTPTDYTYTWRGVPLEMMIQLANAANASPWFNIPAKATDDYVKQFAAVIKKNLHAGLKFYLEYSNETWNGGFSQNAYMRPQGLQLGLSTDPTLAAAFYTAYRSVQIFDIFTSVLGANSGMQRVIASQAANSWLSEQTVLFRNAFAKADVLAIAPYFNCSDTAIGGFGFLGDPATASQVDAMSVDQIVDVELAHVNGCAMQQMQSNAAVAKKYGLALVAYEGGQSLVGYGGAENDATMTGLFKAASRSPRMTSVYTQYLNNWVAAGGDLFVHFNDVGAYTKYGTWGSLEYQDQDPGTAPKYQALASFAASHP